MADATKTATFVIVHGAWGGSYGWTPFAERMRARGHRVFYPSLTGLGERTHLFDGTINLSTHIEDVCGTIKYEQLGKFILAGHSYGGMVAAGVAERYAERISALVYIDAFLPENGKSLFDYTAELNDQRLADAGGNHGGFGVSVPNWGVQGMSDDDRALRSPQPLGTLIEKIKLTGKADTIANRLYVWASRDPGHPFRQFYDRVRAQPGWKVAEVNCGHSVHREKPEELLTLLEGMI